MTETGVLRFQVASRRLSIELARVREVVRPAALKPLARAPAFLEGAIDLRGRLVPVLDLRRKLGGSVGPWEARNRIIIVELRGRPAGLIVDEIGGVEEGAAARGTAEVLDPDTLLSPEECGGFDALALSA